MIKLENPAQSPVDALFGAISFERFRDDYWPLTVLECHDSLSRLGNLVGSGETVEVESVLQAHTDPVKVLDAANPSNHDYRELTVPQGEGLQHFKAGKTICLFHAWRIWPNIATLMLELSRRLGLELTNVQCNAYASPPGSGSPMHFDNHEVIVIQLCGEKDWRIGETTISYPTMNHVAGTPVNPELASYAPEGFDETSVHAEHHVLMKPGSVLFIPRGVWHATNSAAGSLSLSIGFLTPVVCDFILQQVRSMLIQHQEFRKPLSCDWQSVCLPPVVGTILNQLSLEIGVRHPGTTDKNSGGAMT